MRKILLVFLILRETATFAQMTVSGVITDTNRKPIEGVSVSVKNTSVETSTDKAGKYSISIPTGYKTLVYGKEGMKAREIDVNSDIINVTLIFLDHFDLSELSLQELMNVQVISASNMSEKLSEVPATMIVISQQDIRERGYSNISEIFSDLPGMDLSQHYGELAVFNYWRGFRTAYSQPYIFMIDGSSCNDIFYNQPQIMDNIPLSNIDKIEIVYGPVSAVYGANAFMGVVNVITKKNGNDDGISSNARTRISSKGNFIGDMYTRYQKEKLHTSFAARFENTDLARKINLDDYYTNKNLLTDTLLWGGLAKSLNPGAKVAVPYSGKSLDFRLGYDKTEFGIQVNSMFGGYGLVAPFDRTPPNVPYFRDFYYAWLKQEFQLNERVTSSFTFRYISENREKGDYIEVFNYTNNSSANVMFHTDSVKPGETVRAIDYSLWPLKNEKISLSQLFYFNISEKLLLTSGLQFDQTYITKQEGTYGSIFTTNNVSESDVSFYPKNEQRSGRPTNRIVWKDYSVFSQAKYSLSEEHIINFGVRVDHNSEYGTSQTFRGGYVISYNKLTAKLLYGQAYQIPTPRTLYSSGTILGSSSDLKPEKSETVELNVNYTSAKISTWLSTYHVRNRNTIVFIGSNAKNLAERNVTGIDAYINALVPFGFLKKLSIWGYYSMYLKAKEDVFDAYGIKTGTDDIADLAHYKVYFGVTSYFTKKLMLNVRGRYVSDRKAVSTNITSDGQRRVVDAYITMDGNIMYQNLFADGFSVALKIENIFDTKYFHPGINRANSGTDAGFWSNNVWQGSKGWNNSLLPQPHRYITLCLLLNI